MLMSPFLGIFLCCEVVDRDLLLTGVDGLCDDLIYTLRIFCRQIEPD